MEIPTVWGATTCFSSSRYDLKRQIVCMDEATAHVDSGTDNHIQKILREQLSDRTVITIDIDLEL
ncbi:ABC transporter C family member 3 [Orchesella cincta]|uniref:ABC transporter C family member 3 n=1 Tax=Orchesella cincta TaxID=48709 RepID=A0A1D2N5A8_ORCCI|nr:ABC transporter C family member 3 [Orchesella cincta]